MVDKSKHTCKYLYENKIKNIALLGLDDGSKGHLVNNYLGVEIINDRYVSYIPRKAKVEDGEAQT